MKQTFEKVDMWHKPLTINENNFVHKSLSNWSCNIAVGCEHACRFCYVPDVSTRKLGATLAKHGVTDPDADWGNYVLLRPFQREVFERSLRAAQTKPKLQLKTDGNRAVMFCTTTDPYQMLKHDDTNRRVELNALRRCMMRDALTTIRDESSINVRILTRSPLAREDFELMRSFGPRLLFGMSLPTLNNKLAKVYEPHAPSPSKRLETLHAAKSAGLNVFVAVAPTYPECDFDDLRNTMCAIAELKPLTVFAEPINIRSENVERIRVEGARVGVELKLDVFKTPEAWASYAISQLHTTELAASCFAATSKCLHLWPDAALGSKRVVAAQDDQQSHRVWLDHYWQRVSEWAS